MGDPNRYPRSSGLLLTGSVLAFLAAVLLVISFASPYWLESYQATHSSFVRLGLWDVCFNDYRHPPYQYDEKFNGCHWIFSYKYQNIRDWLQPGWMMFVQSMMCVALVLCLGALALVSLVLMRYLLRYEVIVLASAFVLEASTALPLFLAVAVFGGMCYDRSWLQYPMYNYLSWAYAFAVVSFFFHGFASVCLLLEAFKSRDRRRRANNLVYNMQPRF